MKHRSLIESLEGRQLLSAKIAVSANGSGISAGDTTPDRTSYTDFGPAALSGTASVVTRSYTVKNTGTTTITFNSPRATVAGEDAGQFKITKGLPKTLAKGKSATFTVQFDPSSEGTQRANIAITSNASTKTYKFDVKGSGMKTSNIGSQGLQVAMTKTGTGSAAKKGQVLEMNYTGFLLNGSVFDSSVGKSPFSFTSEIGAVIDGWKQGLAGTKAGDKRTLFIPASLAYKDAKDKPGIPPNSTLIFEVETLRVGGPSLKVNTTVGGKTRSITAGDTTPSTSDNTDFGSVKKGKTVTKTFTMALDLYDGYFQQNGYSGVTFTNSNIPVKVTGANASDFTISPTTSSDGSKTYITFIVTFKPSATGTRKATIEIGFSGKTYDPNSNPSSPTVVYTNNATYKFAIQGKGE